MIGEIVLVTTHIGRWFWSDADQSVAFLPWGRTRATRTIVLSPDENTETGALRALVEYLVGSRP